MGYLSDHFNAWLLALSSLVATAFATFVLWGVLGNTFAGLIAFGIAYGIVAGSFSSLFLSFARMYASECHFYGMFLVHCSRPMQRKTPPILQPSSGTSP